LCCEWRGDGESEDECEQRSTDSMHVVRSLSVSRSVADESFPTWWIRDDLSARTKTYADTELLKTMRITPEALPESFDAAAACVSVVIVDPVA